MTTASHPSTYEFSAPENVLIRQLVEAMRFVAAASLALGALVLILGLAGVLTQGRASLGPALGNFAQCLVFVLIGVWLTRAVDAFNKIVESRGDDITHLLQAITELTRVFRLQQTVFVLALLITVLSIGVQGLLWMA
jgi:hypothetical protein